MRVARPRGQDRYGVVPSKACEKLDSLRSETGFADIGHLSHCSSMSSSWGEGLGGRKMETLHFQIEQLHALSSNFKHAFRSTKFWLYC